MAGFKEFTRPTFLVNFFEWVLGLVCLILCCITHCVNSKSKADCIAATYFGFFIVVCILCMSHFMSQPIKGRLMMLTAAVASAMYLVSGALNLAYYANTGKRSPRERDWDDDNKARQRHNNIYAEGGETCLTMGIIALLCSVTYFVNIFVALKF